MSKCWGIGVGDGKSFHHSNAYLAQGPEGQWKSLVVGYPCQACLGE